MPGQNFGKGIIQAGWVFCKDHSDRGVPGNGADGAVSSAWREARSLGGECVSTVGLSKAGSGGPLESWGVRPQMVRDRRAPQAGL